MTPGFTGGTLDRGDPVRNDPEALARAMANPRGRLLRLTRLDPEVADGHLIWDGMGAAHPGGEIILLGLDEAGVPHFAAVNPDEKPVTGRNLAIFRMLEQVPGEEMALYGAARSVVDWHMRHRFCAVCGTGTEAFRAGWGRKCQSTTLRAAP